MKKQSAGILLYRIEDNELQIFLVHPGGPFWKNKDLGAWSIPKGEYEDGEDPLAAAIREVEEETGLIVQGNFIGLSPVRQKSGKIVHAWALEGDFDSSLLKSNTFEMEWPPKSGKRIMIPEVDRGEWFSTKDALDKIIEGQRPLVVELAALLEME